MSDIDMNTIEKFLYEEATYLDQADIENWLGLYAEDGTYWMPAVENQPDPLNHISHFYDDRVLMEIRKRNFVHPRAASKDPQVRCSHIISNIQYQGKTSEGHEIITSNFQVLMWYRDEQRVYGGTYEHHLIANADAFLIHHKKVNLINPEAAHKSIIIYL